jgi:hypothetical protein
VHYVFLKRESPLYAGVSISEEHFSNLPEDGIPHKTMDIMKHSEDVGSLEKEHDDYVPQDNDLGNEGGNTTRTSSVI